MATDTNYNYYRLREGENDGTGQKLMDRPFYQCPVFTTHNTFIRKGFGTFFTEESLKEDEITRLTEELVGLTKFYPVCIEIDNKGISKTEKEACLAGHGKNSNEKNITDLCLQIMDKYYTEVKIKPLYPLILHIDVELEYSLDKTKNCLNPDVIVNHMEEKFNDKYKQQYLSITGHQKSSEDLNYDEKNLSECMSTVIFREKVFGKKVKEIEKAAEEEKLKGTTFSIKYEKDKQKALTELIKLPYVTYQSSKSFVKSLKKRFKSDIDRGNECGEDCKIIKEKFFIFGFHNRLFPQFISQNIFSQVLIEYCIHLFISQSPFYNVPTLIGFNYEIKEEQNPQVIIYNDYKTQLQECFKNFYQGRYSDSDIKPERKKSEEVKIELKLQHGVPLLSAIGAGKRKFKSSKKFKSRRKINSRRKNKSKRNISKKRKYLRRK